MKLWPTRKRLILSFNLTGSLLFFLFSCVASEVTLKELSDSNERKDRLVLDVSKELQWDIHSGEIFRDSMNVIDSVVGFLTLHDNYCVVIKVYYSNQLRKHIESANLMAYNLNKAFLERGVSESRLLYEIAYDKNKTYVFNEKKQKVKIFFNRR